MVSPSNWDALFHFPEARLSILIQRTTDNFRVARHSGAIPKTGNSRLAADLVQFRVLRFRFFQDWDVGVGVFPEGEEVLVGGKRPHAGRGGVSAL
jgi:hypothetical protein